MALSKYERIPFAITISLGEDASEWSLVGRLDSGYQINAICDHCSGVAQGSNKPASSLAVEG